MIFYDNSKFLIEGCVKKNPQLGRFITELATNSSKWFYFDRPARVISDDMSTQQGLLSKKDFENYTVIIRKPLVKEVMGWNIITNAMPTTGGMLITEQLKHAEQNKTADKSIKIIDAMVYADQLKNQQAQI